MNCIICGDSLEGVSRVGRVCEICYGNSCTRRHCRLRPQAEKCTTCIFNGRIGVTCGIELEFDIIEKLGAPKQPKREESEERGYARPTAYRIRPYQSPNPVATSDGATIGWVEREREADEPEDEREQ